MGDVLTLDTAQVGLTASRLDDLAERARDQAASIETALVTAELSRSSVAIVRELGDELVALARFLTATVEQAELADRFGSSISSEGWFAAMRADWVDAERSLWAGLNDDVGATGLEAGEFSLARSIVALDRSIWMQTAIPPGCRSFGPDAYYTGGGAVRGPDGRLYPIVIPHVDRGDEHYTIDADIPDGIPTAASLDGQDPGWVVVSYRTGVEQVHAEISGVWQTLLSLAFATGLRAPATVDDDHLEAIEIRLGGRPTFVGSTSATGSGGVDVTTGQGIQPHTGPVVDGRIGGRNADGSPRTKPLPTPPASPGTVAHANRHVNAASLVINGLQGVQVALSVNDANHRAYEVILEEHADGRLRARVQTFHLEPRRDTVLVAGWHLFVDDDGALRQSPVKYQTPPDDDDADAADDGNDDGEPDGDDDPVAVNGLDHDYTPKVPNPAFGTD